MSKGIATTSGLGGRQFKWGPFLYSKNQWA